jgi:hypothetical protein
MNQMIRSRNVSGNESIKSIVLEKVSQLKIIEKEAFQKSVVQFIALPISVTFLGVKCFSDCGSLFSGTFESGSKLSRNELYAFS